MTSPPKKNTFANGNFILACLTAVYAVLRLALNLKSPDFISTPDELYQGYIATEWLNGLRANLFHYQGDPYTAGSLVLGTLAAPFMGVFGKSLFALKCAPILLSSAAFALLCRLLKQQFGMSAAVATGLLLIFSPPAYTALSMMALGSHPESVLFSVILLGALWNYFQSPSSKNAFFFGVSGGFACWFAQINISADLLCALVFFYYIFIKRLSLSHVVFKFSGAALGFSPWLFYNLTHHWHGAEFLAECLSPGPAGISGALSSIPGIFGSLVLKHFPKSLFLKPFLLSLMYSAVLLSSDVLFGSCAIRERKQNSMEKNLFLFIYAVFPLFFLLIFSYFQTSFNWHYEVTPFRFRYFYPFYYFLTVPVALLAFYYQRFRFLYFFLLACGLCGLLQLFLLPSTLPGTERPGYFLENPERVYDLAYEETKFTPEDLKIFTAQQRRHVAYESFFWASPLQDSQRTEFALTLMPPDRHFFYYKWGKSTEIRKDAQAWTEDPVPSGVPEAERAFFYEGLAAELDWHAFASFAEALTFIRKQPEAAQSYYEMALGNELYHWNSVSLKPKLLFSDFNVSSAGTWILRGIGQSLLWTAESPRAFDVALDKLRPSAQQREEIVWGLGWKLRQYSGNRSLLNHFEKAAEHGYEDYEKRLA